MIAVILMVFVTQLSISDTLWTVEAEGYEIEVLFPEIALENEYVRNTLEEYALEQIESFEEIFRSHHIDEDEPVGCYRWSKRLSLVHEPSPEGMVCILAWHTSYCGGMHSNTVVQSLVFDLNDSSLISTLELLGGEMEFELFASSVIYKLLEIHSFKSWIKSGASADIRNYHTVYPVPDVNGGILGYTVIFHPYQVASYAAGPIEVFIPK